MSCEETTDWVWETGHPDDRPPPETATHLETCPSCSTELAARRAVSMRLRGLRDHLETDPPPGLDRMVLDAASAAVGARESGDYSALVEDLGEVMVGDLADDLAAVMSGEFSDEVADSIAESIAEDYGKEIAALTTSRLDIAALEPPDEVPLSPRARLSPEPSTSSGGGQAWEPPRASAGWLVAATAILLLVASLGFFAGRLTDPAPPAQPQIHTTIATGLEGLGTPRTPRLHDVRLSPGTIEALSEGNTYLLTGPVGGPYEVVGIVGWDTMDSKLQAGNPNDGEIVIAVGPAGGWSRGAQLAVSELSDPGVEIIGRRALP